MDKPIIRHTNDVRAVDCPCGKSTRIITGNDTPHFSLHRTEIDAARVHYHKKLTEIYYILEGTGQMVLDDRTVDIRPGHCIVIPPGVRHNAAGKIKTMIVCLPAFDPEDEYFDE